MPNEEQLKHARAEALVRRARAGVIPASDHIEAEINASVARIARTVSVYAKRVGNCGRDDLAISDILQDLRHYCDSKGLAFDERDTTAYSCYLEDVKESPWISRPQAS
jgi:hypothetical protein